MMKVLCLGLVMLALFSIVVALGQDMTVTDYVSGPALGEIKSGREVSGVEQVQKTPGAHKGHKVLLAAIPLSEGAKTRYAINYSACLDKDKHSNAVELIAKEGMSGLGLSGPTGANWYAGGCIDVLINGRGLGAYRPRLERLTYTNGAASAGASWTCPWGSVALTFTQTPESDRCYVRVKIDCPTVNSLVVRLMCFPSGYAEPRRRAAWTASAVREGPGRLIVPMRDNWIAYGDLIHDRAKDTRGAGACAVMFSRTEVQTARVNVTGYPVSTNLTFRPDIKDLHLVLWELPHEANDQAIEHMREIAQNLKSELGRNGSQTVITEGVPPRAIVVEGKPAASILLRKDAQNREIEGAIELQDYVAKATGAILPIAVQPDMPKGYVIRINVRQPEQGESAEAFSLRVSARQTDIVGNSPLAALYGVYDLLERGVGVRWYLPGELGEVVPKTRTLVLPSIDLKESPSFPMRWIGRGQWMLHNKQNQCEDGFYIYPGIYHTQNSLLPHRKYFKEHPEYFALIKGKRSENSQCKLCYSNPDVAREVAKNMAAMLDDNPNISLISLSPTDGQQWCECDKCKAMDEKGVPSDRRMSRRSLLFYNSVAAELRKTHPDAKMLVGAYNVYNWPPKDPNLKADPMLAVIITHYENYCLAHPVPDPTCTLNKRYVQLIKEWQAIGCDVYFYEYYWKVNWLDLPWPIVHSIRGDMPWYKEQGCRGVYTQYTTGNIWTLYPAHYVAARLLWDVDADVDAIVEKMYEDLFDAAARHIKAYYALMEKQMAECGRHFPGRGLSYGPVVFNDEVRAKLRELYEKAIRANKDETVALRLKKIGTSLEYVERLMRYASLKRKANSEGDPAKALAIARETLEVGDALVAEIRKDRGKWEGVVSTSVVGAQHYLGGDVNRWRASVAKRQAADVTVVASFPKTWKFSLDPKDVGQKEGWLKTDFNDSDWKQIEIGQTWESQGYDYDGFAWYRVEVTVKPEWLKTSLAIHFGAVDGEAWVYWNGALLGYHKGWDEPFSFSIKPELIKTDQANVIAVRVWDGTGPGGIYKMVYLAKGR